MLLTRSLHFVSPFCYDSSWMQVYPCYIDGTKTVAEGRRIPKELACKKQPWAKDIVEALKELQLSQAFEVNPVPFLSGFDQIITNREHGAHLQLDKTTETKHHSCIARFSPYLAWQDTPQRLG